MDNNTLYVQFLGSFSVRWNGGEIFSDVKTGGTQMLCFLQMLLLDPEQGVARSQLVEELFYLLSVYRGVSADAHRQPLGFSRSKALPGALP